ncbi:hypothetical protein HC256_001982 [Beauveria bassiana]|nr:hypothetical protein HC256_001982 [Beauveria bassiana]
MQLDQRNLGRSCFCSTSLVVSPDLGALQDNLPQALFLRVARLARWAAAAVVFGCFGLSEFDPGNREKVRSGNNGREHNLKSHAAIDDANENERAAVPSVNVAQGSTASAALEARVVQGTQDRLQDHQGTHDDSELSPIPRPAHMARKAIVWKSEWNIHLPMIGIKSAPAGYRITQTIIIKIP